MSDNPDFYLLMMWPGKLFEHNGKKHSPICSVGSGQRAAVKHKVSQVISKTDDVSWKPADHEVKRSEFCCTLYELKEFAGGFSQSNGEEEEGFCFLNNFL